MGIPATSRKTGKYLIQGPIDAGGEVLSVAAYRADVVRVKTKPTKVASDAYLQALVGHTLGGTHPALETGNSGQEQAKMVRRQVAARNLFFLNELHKCLRKVQDAGIDVVVLKGAALSESLYPHLGLRAFGDIDLLVHREDLARLGTVLGDLGFCKSADEAEGLSEFQGQPRFLKDGEVPVLIEAHWRLGAYPFSARVELDGLWQRASRAKVAGIDTLVLCPEDCLLHLCLHMFQHPDQNRQVSSCDIAALVRSYQASLDWDAFLDRVFRFGVCLPVRYSLQKTAAEFDLPVPASVMDRLAAFRPGGFQRRIFASLTYSAIGDGTRSLAILLTVPGARAKLGYLRALFAQSTESGLARRTGVRAVLPIRYALWLGESSGTALKAAVRLVFARTG